MSWSSSVSLEIAAMFAGLSWRADDVAMAAERAVAKRRAWRADYDKRRRKERASALHQYRIKYLLARKNDPDWLARERKRNRDLHRAKYWADAAYRERKRAASREYQRRKAAMRRASPPPPPS